MMRLGAMVMAVVAAMLALAAPAAAQYVEGTDYVRIDAPLPNAAPGTVQVTYFFDYACPHCFAFEPAFDAWRASAPADVRVEIVPLRLATASRHLARLHYVLAGRGQRVPSQPLFDLIHKAGVLPSEAGMPGFLAAQGVPMAEATALLADPAITEQVAAAEALAQRARVRAWPAVVVGPYRVDAATAGGVERMVPIMNFLIDRLRAKR